MPSKIYRLNDPNVSQLFKDKNTLYQIPGYSKASSEKLSAVILAIKEGKFHQIKKMAEAVGNKVKYLKRLKM
jgi:16S rRNA U516 pseudouridylate synthase RsuA-like enzyme